MASVAAFAARIVAFLMYSRDLRVGECFFDQGSSTDYACGDVPDYTMGSNADITRYRRRHCRHRIHSPDKCGGRWQV